MILYSSAVGFEEDEDLPFGARCLGNGILCMGCGCVLRNEFFEK